jgi:hypothetical protein
MPRPRKYSRSVYKFTATDANKIPTPYGASAGCAPSGKVVDGIQLSRFVVALTYDVGTVLATHFLGES